MLYDDYANPNANLLPSLPRNPTPARGLLLLNGWPSTCRKPPLRSHYVALHLPPSTASMRGKQTHSFTWFGYICISHESRLFTAFDAFLCDYYEFIIHAFGGSCPLNAPIPSPDYRRNCNYGFRLFSKPLHFAARNLINKCRCGIVLFFSKATLLSLLLSKSPFSFSFAAFEYVTRFFADLDNNSLANISCVILTHSRSCRCSANFT